MKFTAKNQNSPKTPKAYLVQSDSRQYVAFCNNLYLHTLVPSGGGSVEYAPSLNYSLGDTILNNETVIGVFYEGDTLEITF